MINENRFYNYLYLDPTKPVEYKIKGLDIILKYEPFYVGKGSKSRLNIHKYGHTGKFIKSKIKSLKDKNIKPLIIKINNNISEFEAFENEKYLIKAIGRRDLGLGSLCNLTDGGEGISNPGLETRIKMSNAKKGKSSSRKGSKLSIETKLKLSLLNSGKNHPNFGKKNSEETRRKISLTRRKIPILQLSLDGILIKEFSSVTEAANSLNIFNSNIVKCLKGKIKTYKNYKWRYKN